MKINPKHVFPLEFNYYVKYFFDFHKHLTPSFANTFNKEDKHIFFLDCPEYGNLGDQAIALAMRNFMQEILPQYIQYEITENKLPFYLKWLKANITNKDIICLTGGGNMGVDYQHFEAVRRVVLRNFSNNIIIIFPQTYDYGVTNYGKKEQRRAKQLYNKIPNLILCAREENSYNLMKKDFPNVKVILCPDIVLSLDYSSIGKNRQNVGICFRDDKEKVVGREQKNFIISSFPDYQEISTTLKTDKSINENNRKEIVENLLREISSLRLLVTDRLHGMIFAYITNTPCIAFPNSNKKIKYVFDKWLKGKGAVSYLEDINKLPKNMEQQENNKSLTEYFGELKKLICEYASIKG